MSFGLFMLAGIAIDTGRTYSAHSQLQAFADSVALAAARELDGEPGAMNRARAVVDAAFVAANMSQSTRFGSAATRTFELDTVYFLSSEPQTRGGRLAPNYAANVALSDGTASHVLVKTKPVDVPWTLMRFASTNGAANSQISTWAAATMNATVATDEVVASAVSGASAASLSSGGTGGFEPGAMTRLRKNTDGTWEAGEYGINLDMADDAQGTCSAYVGVNQLYCLMAINKPAPVFGAATVDLMADTDSDPLTGSEDFNVYAALNTRFGIYDPSVSFLQNLAAVSSDVSTIKGKVYSCSGPVYGAVADTVALPRDPCFHQGTCSVTSDGTITQEMLEIYWEHTHADADENNVQSYLPSGINTRYDMYRYEVESHFGTNASPVDLTTNGNENNQTDFTVAGDACNPNSTARADRRKLTVALVDATTLNGEVVRGAEVLRYAEFFLTEPVGHDEMVTIDFDGWHAGVGGEGHTFALGDVMAAGYSREDGTTGVDYYANLGVTFEVVRSRKNMERNSKERDNVPMLFDTSRYTGGDADLEHTSFGHVLIISEDGDGTPNGEPGSSSWRRSGPDDEGGGGWLLIHFDEAKFPNGVYLDSVTIFDADNGGIIYTYDSIVTDPYGEFGNSSYDETAPNLYAWDTGAKYDDNEDGSPAHPGYDTRSQLVSNCEDGDGDGLCDADASVQVSSSHGIAVPQMHDGDSFPVNINQDNVKTLAYFMPNSGGIDNIRFFDYEGNIVPLETDEMFLEFVRFLDDSPNRNQKSYDAVLSN